MTRSPAHRSIGLDLPTSLLVAGISLLSLPVFLREFPGPTRPIPKDFSQYLVAGRAVLRGEPEALYFANLEAGLQEREFPGSRWERLAAEAGVGETSFFLYPPWVAAAYAPLALLPPRVALQLVHLFHWAVTVLAFLLLARALPRHGAAAAGMAFVAFLGPPFLEALRNGQVSIVVLLLLVLMARALWAGREREAGLWWGLMIGLKLFPVLFVFYAVATRRWRFLVAGALTGLALAAAGLAVGGRETSVRYARLVLDHAAYATTWVSNQSVTALFLRAFDGGDPRSWLMREVPATVAWLTRAAVALWLAATIWIARRTAAGPPEWRDPMAVSLFTLWVFSASPSAWLHHLVVLALPLAVAAARCLELEGSRRLGTLALWSASAALVFLHDAYLRTPGAAWGHPPLSLVASVPLAGIVVLFGLLAHWGLSAPRPSGPVALAPLVVTLLLASAGTAASATLTGTVQLLAGGKAVASGEVRDAVVYWSPDRGAATAPAPQPVEIAMREKEFLPPVVAVTRGSAVRFPNADPILHNVFSVSPENPFDLGLYGPGHGKSVRMDSPGLVRVYCNVHHAMAAHVLVLDTPHFVSPGPTGEFSLEGLPEGAGTLHVWHARAEPWSRVLTLPASAPVVVPLAITRRRVAPHFDKTGRPYRERRDDAGYR
jgi:plastocyanin